MVLRISEKMSEVGRNLIAPFTMILLQVLHILLRLMPSTALVVESRVMVIKLLWKGRV